MQYPKGLGSTVKELDISKAVGKYEKTKFSMLVPDVEEKMKTLCDGDVQHVVLFGIEVHKVLKIQNYKQMFHMIFAIKFELHVHVHVDKVDFMHYVLVHQLLELTVESPW